MFSVKRWPLSAFMFLLILCFAENALASDKITYDPSSGLAIGPGFELVLGHCSACHSSKLVTQNRMSRENWLSIIRWMQKKQGLWPLGNNEALILDYLAAYYGPVAVSRRPPIPKHLMPRLNKAKESD